MKCPEQFLNMIYALLFARRTAKGTQLVLTLGLLFLADYSRPLLPSYFLLFFASSNPHQILLPSFHSRHDMVYKMSDQMLLHVDGSPLEAKASASTLEHHERHWVRHRRVKRVAAVRCCCCSCCNHITSTRHLRTLITHLTRRQLHSVQLCGHVHKHTPLAAPPNAAVVALRY